MQRNIGSAFGHGLLAIDNAHRGLDGFAPVPDGLIRPQGIRLDR